MERENLEKGTVLISGTTSPVEIAEAQVKALVLITNMTEGQEVPASVALTCGFSAALLAMGLEIKDIKKIDDITQQILKDKLKNGCDCKNCRKENECKKK